MVATCAAFGVTAGRREGHPGCWCDPDGPAPRKIGALGIRVERGVSYHGIALNVDPDLSDFDLIDPCGMPGVISTSMANELRLTTGSAPAKPPPADAPTGIAKVTGSPDPSLIAAAAVFARALAGHLGAELVGFGDADPAGATLPAANPAPGA
jgi:hypothetical protein